MSPPLKKSANTVCHDCKISAISEGSIVEMKDLGSMQDSDDSLNDGEAKRVLQTNGGNRKHRIRLKI
jgi:hypothetical protein